jgi:hypothetical protein
MNEQLFIQIVNSKAHEWGVNPLLLLSGIEGLYTFKDVELSAINYEFLDSLILTIFALRIGDQFHTLAEENLTNSNEEVRLAAYRELTELTTEQINNSANHYLQSFATILQGKSSIRGYHVKALEVAALEINKARVSYGNASIGAIVLDICKSDQSGSLDLAAIFSQ